MTNNFVFNSFCFLLILGLILSGIKPFDYFTWFLEVFPALIALIVIIISRRKFSLSNLLYVLILLHCYVLFIGGHYTYAKVPFFDWIKDLLQQDRNNYDKVGHFIQGFVPAIIAREILLRKHIVHRGGWLSFIIVSICLAISAFYELIEAFVAIMTGESAEAFLGTQGYVWDTQTDMLLALLGAIIALVGLARFHDQSMKKIGQ